MGYTLKIGEAIICTDDNLLSIAVKDEEHLGIAPAFGEGATDFRNYRSPSYRQWNNFCRQMNLLDLFYKEGGQQFLTICRKL
jgi:hypothetical protein